MDCKRRVRTTWRCSNSPVRSGEIMKAWNWSKTGMVGVIAILGTGLWCSTFPLGGVADARGSAVANGEVERPGMPAANAEKAVWKPQPFTTPGSDGTGEVLAGAEAAKAEITSDAVIMNLPTIESVLFGEDRETVCGTDTRTRQTATTSNPWRMNCLLIISNASGVQGTGTGWMGARGTVFTAGHCVHTGGPNGKYFTKVEVIPGANRNANGTVHRPYGTFFHKSLRTSSGWVANSSPEYDFGAIILRDGERPGDRTGYYGFTALSDASLSGLTVNTAGYPGDKPSGTQWYTSGTLNPPTVRRLFYMMDTAGGQSGSAVYRLQDGQRQGVGIHAYGGCPNGATRITTAVFNTMLGWKNLTQ